MTKSFFRNVLLLILQFYLISSIANAGPREDLKRINEIFSDRQELLQSVTQRDDELKHYCLSEWRSENKAELRQLGQKLDKYILRFADSPERVKKLKRLQRRINLSLDRSSAAKELLSESYVEFFLSSSSLPVSQKVVSRKAWLNRNAKALERAFPEESLEASVAAFDQYLLANYELSVGR